MATQEVTLNPGESRVITFQAAPTEAKTYSVSVNGLTGSFVARAAAQPVITDVTWENNIDAKAGDFVKALVTIDNPGEELKSSITLTLPEKVMADGALMTLEAWQATIDRYESQLADERYRQAWDKIRLWLECLRAAPEYDGFRTTWKWEDDELIYGPFLGEYITEAGFSYTIPNGISQLPVALFILNRYYRTGYFSPIISLVGAEGNILDSVICENALSVVGLGGESFLSFEPTRVNVGESFYPTIAVWLTRVGINDGYQIRTEIFTKYEEGMFNNVLYAHSQLFGPEWWLATHEGAQLLKYGENTYTAIGGHLVGGWLWFPGGYGQAKMVDSALAFLGPGIYAVRSECTWFEIGPGPGQDKPWENMLVAEIEVV